MDIPDTKSRSQLKAYFVKNAIPTEGQFADLIEAGVNQRDDGLIKTKGKPLSIEAGGDDNSQKRVLSLFRNATDRDPACVLSLNPFGNPADVNTRVAGLGIGDAHGNTRLFLDPGTGRIGLGTVQPNAGLDIRSSNNNVWLSTGPGGDGGRVILRYGGSGNPGAPEIMLSDADDPPRIRFNNIGNGTEASPQFSSWIGMARGRTNHLSLMADRVGIGTDNPQAKLQVTGGAIMPSAGNNENSGILFPRDPFGGSGDRAWLRYYTRGGEAATLELGIRNDTKDHIALMPSGNVGIGTNNPSDQLHVHNGDLRISGGRYRRLKIVSDKYFAGIELVARSDGENGHPYIDFTKGNLDSPNYGVRLYAPDNDTLRLTGGKLIVEGAIECGNSYIHFTKTNQQHSGKGNTLGVAAIENAKNYNALMILGRTTGDGSSLNRRVRLWDYLQVNGTFVNNSDIREKSDIELLNIGLEAIKRLRPVSFNWREKVNPHKTIGLIAQEVREVLADVVYEDDESLSISYISIIPVLIKAIQELELKFSEAIA